MAYIQEGHLDKVQCDLHKYFVLRKCFIQEAVQQRVNIYVWINYSVQKA